MSKLATGSCGYAIGSARYIQNMNNEIFLGELLNNKSDYNYKQTLDKLYNKINDVINSIYADLTKNARILRFLSDSYRSDMIDFIERLDKTINFICFSNTNASYCINLLNLSDSSTDKYDNFSSDSKIDDAISLIEHSHNFYMSTNDALMILSDLASDQDRSYSFNENKLKFYEELKDMGNTNFFKDVRLHYSYKNNEIRFTGRYNAPVFDDNYIEELHEQIFEKNIDYPSDYVQEIRESILYIKNKLEQDLEYADIQGDYLTDGAIETLNDLFRELESLPEVGSTYSIEQKCQDLCNHVEVDVHKTRQLQEHLNRLGFYNGDIDGVYNKNTNKAMQTMLKCMIQDSYYKIKKRDLEPYMWPGSIISPDTTIPTFGEKSHIGTSDAIGIAHELIDTAFKYKANSFDKQQIIFKSPKKVVLWQLALILISL